MNVEHTIVGNCKHFSNLVVNLFKFTFEDIFIYFYKLFSKVLYKSYNLLISHYKKETPHRYQYRCLKCAVSCRHKLARLTYFEQESTEEMNVLICGFLFGVGVRIALNYPMP